MYSIIMCVCILGIFLIFIIVGLVGGGVLLSWLEFFLFVDVRVRLILLKDYNYYGQGLMKIIPTGYLSPILSSKVGLGVSLPSSIMLINVHLHSEESFDSKVSSNPMSTGILPRLVHHGLNCHSVARYRLNP